MSSVARSDGRCAEPLDPVDAASGFPRIDGLVDVSWKTPLTRIVPDLYRPASALRQEQG